MSSDGNPQYYPGPPSGPPGYPQQQPPYQPQQPGYGPAPQPYVEQGVPLAPHQGAGGQPPYVPPGAYTPVPPPPPGRGGRGAKIAIASILSVAVLLAVGAVVLFKFVLVNGPDPAESFPASASMYVEVNFDPSFDQTPKLLDHLSKFDELDYDTTDDLLADLLEESGLEGVDAEEDLSSWLGKRHGIAMWEHDGEQYGVVSLASTDAGAAEDGLAKFRAASGAETDQWAYTVEDDHVLMVLGETGAEDALAAAESEAGDKPLSASSSYEEARSWLDGDQLIVSWVDMDAVADLAAMEMGDEGADMVEKLYSGQMITGLAAFDDGFEMTYRLFGTEDDAWEGSENLIADMGDLPASDIAASAYIPENIGDMVGEWLGMFEDLYGYGDDYATVYGEPLTDDEYAEYLELESGYYAGTLSADQEARFEELQDRYWMAGTEDDPYYDDYSSGGDFGEIEDQVNEAVDLLAGASLSFAGSFDDAEGVDPDSAYFSANLDENRAQELEDLIASWTQGQPLPEGVEVDGSELSYTGAGTGSGKLSDDSRFDDFASVAPDRSAVAVWIDLAAAQESFPGEFDGAEPLSAFAWAHGSEDGDGVGVLRLYLK